MHLAGGKRGLFAPLTTKEVRIFREKGPTQVKVARPFTEVSRQSDLGLEQPPVGTDIDQELGIVLSKRSANYHTCADNEFMGSPPKILRFQRG